MEKKRRKEIVKARLGPSFLFLQVGQRWSSRDRM